MSIEIFWGYVEKTESCWFFTGTPSQKYPKLRFRGEMMAAHRVSFLLHNGTIEDGMYVCHTCDNTRCVNPDHLFLGTADDNNKDMMRKGRDKHVSGQTHYKAKLTNLELEAVKTLYASGKYSQYDLADLFKVRQSSISRIINKVRRADG